MYNLGLTLSILLAGLISLHNKIDTASYTYSDERTWIVVGHQSLYIIKEGLPIARGKADGVPQLPIAGDTSDMKI